MPDQRAAVTRRRTPLLIHPALALCECAVILKALRRAIVAPRPATHGAGRADVDHYKNLSTGLTKLRNSLARWDDLGGEERAEIEAVWQELWKQMPGSWKTTAKKLEGWK